jgi:hypothetical protein
MREARGTCWCARLGLGWLEEGWPRQVGRTGLGRRGSVARGEPIPGVSSSGGGLEGRVRHGGARQRQW